MDKTLVKILASLHRPAKESHKGQNGKLMVISGGRMYCGCAIFNLLAARRFVDLIYFYPGEKDQYLIQVAKSVPEVIVVSDTEKMRDTDCVLLGGGTENSAISFYLLKEAKKVVVDASGFNHMRKEQLDSRFILTPHMLEFERFFGIPANEQNAVDMARKYGCVILLKGTPDIISDGTRIFKNDTHNQGMTKGGTGDVLAGLVAALACTNQNYEAAVAAAYINGLAGNMLLKKYGYNFCASDLADSLGSIHAQALGLIKKYGR